MSDTQMCEKCGGLLDREYDQERISPPWWKCIQCGRRTYPPVPTRPNPPEQPGSKNVCPRNRKAHYGLKKIPVPNLAPPTLPKSGEDWEGAYEIQCGTYAAYQHFREQAILFHKKVAAARKQSSKASYGYRARLCENLATTLSQIYSRQSSAVLRKLLREQRRVNHVVGENDRGMIALMKQYNLLMRQASSDLPDDPIAQTWLASREALGNYDYLRKARKGLERGVSRPYRNSKLALADFLALELANEGMSLGKIQKTLKTEGLPFRSRQGILKRLKSLTIHVEPKKTRSSKMGTGGLSILLRSVAPVIPPRSKK